MGHETEVIEWLRRVEGSLAVVQRGQEGQLERLREIDGRLRRLEGCGGWSGAAAGGAVAMVVTTFVTLLKARLEAGG